MRDSAYVQALGNSALAAQLAARNLVLESGKAWVLADSPSKAGRSGGDRRDFLIRRLREQALGATHELLVSSPYFVPRERGVEALTGLVKEGVAVAVLTNSLAANDVGIVHSGYARYRAPLLRGGVRLHELRALSELATRREGRRRFGSEYVSLHAKYLVIDRSSLFVGSLNLDPRSIERNTEVGLLIDSASLARQAAELFDLASAKAFSYSVALRDGASGRSDALVWTGENPGGRELRYDREPDTSWWQRFTVWLAGLLPFVESQI